MTLELLAKVKHAQDRAKNKPEATAKTFLENFHLFRGRMVEQLRLAQTEPLDFFKCNSKWPMCAFFYLGRHVIPEQFSFKCEQSLDSLVNPNYFSKEFLTQPVKTIDRASASTTAANLLLERGFHYCKINLFVNTLASLFVN